VRLQESLGVGLGEGSGVFVPEWLIWAPIPKYRYAFDSESASE